MKITGIRVRNVLGARDVTATLTQPVALFCGFNGAGKSSMQEAVRLALQGETLRVEHKKDFPLMVSEGAKDGFVKVTVDGAEYEYRLPSGEHTVPREFTTAEAGHLNAVLNAQRFASMSPDDRRTFLINLTGSTPNKEKIKALMMEAGLDEARVEVAIPMLRSGFPAACDMAKSKATEAKGAWKQVAGGVWGALKGAAWEAPTVEAPDQEALDAAQALVTEKEAEHAELQQQLGATVEKFNAATANATKIDAAKAKVANLPRLREKLVRDEQSLNEYKGKLADLQAKAGTKPLEGLVHDMALFLNGIEFEAPLDAQARDLLARYEGEFGKIGVAGDPEALGAIPAYEKSVGLMETSVANDKRDIAAAEQAEAQLAVLNGVEGVAEGLLEQVKASVAEAAKELDEARKELKALQELAATAAQRDEKTATAKKHHEDVVGWLKVADQFAPDGLPSQILAKALEPINKQLREAATATNWLQVAIRPDQSIVANGRLYSLLSESEKWMVDAHIAYVIAQIAGLKLIVLDRFDVLDVNHRPELLQWLADMAYEGKLDTALVFGTLKAMPGGLPEEIQPIWIEHGELAGAEKMAA